MPLTVSETVMLKGVSGDGLPGAGRRIRSMPDRESLGKPRNSQDRRELFGVPNKTGSRGESL